MFIGALFIIMIFILFGLLLPGSDDPWIDWLELFSSFYTFRFLFMIVLLLLFAGVDVLILRHFKVNYLFIFELDPTYKITHV